MEHRPRITIEAGRTDRVMDAVGWFLFALLIALSVYAYFDLPDTISVHTGKGSDSKGDKALILLLPIIGIALFAGMKILMQYPHRFNYLTKITPENARTQYTAAIRMMRLLNIILLVEFIVSVTDIYLEEKGITTIPGAWLVVFVVLTGSVPLMYFLWATGKNKG